METANREGLLLQDFERRSYVFRGAGTGGLGLAMEGPSEAKMSCIDNKDGSCSVEYVPYEPGTYNLNITYGGQPITGGWDKSVSVPNETGLQPQTGASLTFSDPVCVCVRVRRESLLSSGQ